MPAVLPQHLPAAKEPVTDDAGAGSLVPRLSETARAAELAKLTEFAHGKAAGEWQAQREARGNPSRLLAMRASEATNKSSSSSGCAGGSASKDEILAQVCAALGVDAAGKPVAADDIDGEGLEPKVDKEKKKKKRRKKQSTMATSW